MQILPYILSLIGAAPTSKKANKPIVQHQLLDAVVIKENTAGTKKTALIRINHQAYRALLPEHLNLKNRQWLRLQVMSVDRPMQLKIVDINPPNPVLQLQNTLLREVIPKQQSLDRLFGFINQQQTQITTQTGPVLQKIASAIASLQQAVPEKNSLFNAAGVIQAIKNSGLFMEAKLRSQIQKTQATNVPTRPASLLVQTLNHHDLKAVLLRTAQQLTQQHTKVTTQKGKNINKPTITTAAVTLANTKVGTPVSDPDIQNIATELNKHIQSSIARIEANQARALAAENISSNWMIDIPVQDNQDLSLIELQIKKERTQKEEQGRQSIWSITVHLHLGEIGMFHARLFLNGANLTTTLWAEQDAAYGLIQDHIPMLRDRLEKTGLDIQAIDCLTGPPSMKQPSHTENLINTMI